MGVIQVIADRAGAGKTCLAGALLIRSRGEGKEVGYCKPFSAFTEDDPDVAFVSRHLLAGRDGPGAPVPWPMPEVAGTGSSLLRGLGSRIKSAINKLEADTGLVLVEGPDLHQTTAEASPLALELGSLLNSRVLLLFRYAKGLDAATVASASEPFGDRLAGVVINGVPLYRLREVNDELLVKLRSDGLPVLGALPEDRAMLAVRVPEIANCLSGRWIQEPVNTDTYVDRFIIGGNIMDSGMTYFGRFDNQAVITRAERPDIQLASLMAGTRCLVLTGGAEPAEYIKAEALQREVPVVLVQEDTLTTAEALGGLLERVTAHSRQKIDRFAELVQQHLDSALLDSAMS